jgi:hypothetical protein
MSQENVEVMRRCFQLLQRGEIQEVLDYAYWCPGLWCAWATAVRPAEAAMDTDKATARFTCAPSWLGP